MKKAVSIILMAVLIMMLVGCGGSKSSIEGTWEHESNRVYDYTFTGKEFSIGKGEEWVKVGTFSTTDDKIEFIFTYAVNGEKLDKEYIEVMSYSRTDNTLTIDGMLF